MPAPIERAEYAASPPSALPGISPTGGEIGWALSHVFDRILSASLSRNG
ncbi:hypothetical protein [Agrobacterium rosae]